MPELPDISAYIQALEPRIVAQPIEKLHWRNREAKLGGRQNLAALDFPNGSLVITEAGAHENMQTQK